MFLKRRSLQAEYFDLPDRPVHELADGYRMLAHMNRIFLLREPFQRRFPRWLGEKGCKSLSILDLGAGDGSFGGELSEWAKQRGWDWRFTNLDVNIQAMRLSPTRTFVAGSALALPFRDNSFDVVIGSQMAHHLNSDEEVCRHFREAWRVTGDLLFLNDLHRNVFLYAVVWAVLRLHRYPRHFLTDGLLSVKRAWRVREWRALAERACIPNARISLYMGARVLLAARKGKA
jgi:2-polyprenyl-3-methyl-5-hydroxy-6-metoxy-1,4-benzoquinol methylase